MDVLTDIIGKKIVGEDLDGVTDGVIHLDELSDGSVKIVNLNSK